MIFAQDEWLQLEEAMGMWAGQFMCESPADRHCPTVDDVLTLLDPLHLVGEFGAKNFGTVCAPGRLVRGRSHCLAHVG